MAFATENLFNADQKKMVDALLGSAFVRREVSFAEPETSIYTHDEYSAEETEQVRRKLLFVPSDCLPLLRTARPRPATAIRKPHQGNELP